MTLLELIANCVNFTTQDEEDINPSNLETYRNSTNYRAFLKNALPEINRAIQELVVLKKLPLNFINIYNPNEALDDLNRYPITTKDVYRIFKVEIYSNGTLYSPVEFRREGVFLTLPSVFDRQQIERIVIKYHPRPRLLTEADKGTLEFGTEAIEVSLDEFVSLIKNKNLQNGSIYRVLDLKEQQYKVATSTYGYRDATEEDGYVSVDNSLDLNTIGLNDTICTMVIPYLVKSRIWQEVEPEMAQLDRNIGLQNASMLVDGEEEVYQSYVARNGWGD